ncbi:MAG: CHASE2 domain-containing protein [Pseudomonadota bacterium]
MRIASDRRHWRWVQFGGGIAIVAVLLLDLVGWMPLTFLERLEWQSYDTRVRATLSEEADPSLAIIDIDERSLYEVGQWPWPRTVIAELVETLFDSYDAALLGMDIVFAEPEVQALNQYWKELVSSYPELEGRSPPENGDDVLAETLANFPVVLGYYFQANTADNDPPSVGALPDPVEVADSPLLALLEPERFTGNLPALQQNAMGGGFFDNPKVDDDGVFRRVPLLQRWENAYYPSLPMAMLMVMIGGPTIQPQVAESAGTNQLEALDVGGFEIPVDNQGVALVPWYGERGHFTYISAADVLNKRVDADELAGKTLILGASAPGLMDLRSTPVGSVFPGAEVNMSLLAGMLHQSIKAQPPWVAGFELISLVLLGVLVVLVYPHLSAPVLLLASAVLMALTLGGNLWAWQHGLVLPLASLLVLFMMQMLWHLGLNFLRESHQKRWIAERFGQYIPPQLVDDMVESGESIDLEGEERELTVLFSDVREFTAFSESIPPKELTQVMNRLLTPLTGAIHAHNGTIDKYMGDAIMAFWGAPLHSSEHADQAIEGAFAMLAALDEINQAFTKEGKPPLAMGVGVNTGKMSVGNMGSSFRMAYTVMGDNVNLGARLEGLTKAYGASVLVSEITAKQAPRWCYRRLDKVRVKGRSAPLWVLEPLGKWSQLSESIKVWQASFEQAVDLYQAGAFAQAETAFSALSDPQDLPTQLYLQRITYFKAHPPPPDWDGVWTHTDK